MKGLAALLVIGLIAVGGGYYFMGRHLAADPGELVAFACGNPDGERQQIQIVVPIVFPKREPPRLSENDVQLWEEWIAEHWIITAPDGERVPLQRQFAANLIPQAKVASPDCYLVGQVRAGVEYTFDFVPSLAEQKRYRRTFVVADEGVPFKRMTFALVEPN